MPVPVWSPGQVLTASDVNTWFVPVIAYKTTDLGRTTTSQTADPDITLAVAANSTYTVEGVLFYKSTTAGTDFQWTWAIPAGTAGGLYVATYLGSGGGAVVADTNGWTDPAKAADATVANQVYGVRISGTLSTGGTAGNFTLLWAASAGAPTTTLTARTRIQLNKAG